MAKTTGGSFLMERKSNYRIEDYVVSGAANATDSLHDELFRDQRALRIPGLAEYQRAEKIMNDHTVPIQQRIQQAAPYFDKAIEESKKIDVTRLEQQLAVASPQEQNAILQLRNFPVNVRMISAISHNMAATQMYEQAVKNPAKKEELMRAGDELNRKGITTLRTIEQDDPRAWAGNFMIRGAIARMQNRETVNIANLEPDKAAGGVLGVKKEVDEQINSPIPGFQPVSVPVNILGKALRSSSEVPVVGWVAGAFGDDILNVNKLAPKLAEAKSIDENAANKMVGQIRNRALTEGVHTIADITSAQMGMAAARIGMQVVGNKIPGIGKVVGYIGMGLAATTGANAVIDYAANKTLGVEQRDGLELFTRSTASFGTTWGLSRAASFREATLGKSVTMSFNGEKIQVPSKLTEGWLSLTPQGRQAVGEAIRSKYTAQEFAALNSGKQYTQFLTAHGDVTKASAQSLAGGSRWKTRLPFTGYKEEARSLIGQIEKPWTYTRTGKFAWNVGTGAAAMGIYGLGEVNPLLTNKDTGKNYSLSDTFEHARDNMLAGGIASGVAAPMMPWALNSFNIAKPIAGAARWLFNTEAARASKPLASLRAGFGTAKDALVHNSVTTAAYDRLANNAAARSLKAGWSEYSSTMLRPMALAEAQGAGNVYAHQAWGDIEKEADALLKIHREKQTR